MDLSYECCHQGFGFVLRVFSSGKELRLSFSRIGFPVTRFVVKVQILLFRSPCGF